MQWGQIKTLFIISFLILNVFLGQQLFEKISDTDLERSSQASFEDRLNAQEIEIGELPEPGEEEVYISSNRYEFTEEDYDNIDNSFNNQQMVIMNDDTIVSQFNEPLELDGGDNDVLDHVYRGEEYQFWKSYNDRIILYFQKQNDRPVFFNYSGVLAVLLNENGEVTSYAQTLLGEPEEESEPQTVLDPMSVIKILYSDVLESQDEITDMSLGYHTLVPLEEGEQIFTPTWKITINDEETHFVNAIEGQVIPNEEEEFVDSITYFVDYQVEELIRSETE
ncbi:two-component system regulatory protein YycI [Alkalibacillus salilacus]|uniref:Regulatory protein YycI of two-component signal transduction system YycFG n=1 Tax=Alkalibacillus salilacus TaxID=284582 RepID=A0ABT9VBL8_9BACI|nr:two-component system regulatory protein YycI [Alkalibacillus salilacus]MDQ0158361.1 regulatory protein YycI of two-component signal transduction system YycFG [Alkalibacillus salilacus]